MSDPSWPMQQVIYAALVPALTGVSVVDSVPAEPSYPMVRIGESQSLEDDTGCALAWEHFETVHIFSRAPDARPEVKRIGALARAALVEGVLAPVGFVMTLQEYRELRVFMEADGVTAHGVLTVRYLIDAAA